MSISGSNEPGKQETRECLAHLKITRYGRRIRKKVSKGLIGSKGDSLFL
jgi:hypothetical protein